MKTYVCLCVHLELNSQNIYWAKEIFGCIAVDKNETVHAHHTICVILWFLKCLNAGANGAITFRNLFMKYGLPKCLR
jgi:hypothetical protein